MVIITIHTVTITTAMATIIIVIMVVIMTMENEDDDRDQCRNSPLRGNDPDHETYPARYRPRLLFLQVAPNREMRHREVMVPGLARERGLQVREIYREAVKGVVVAAIERQVVMLVPRCFKFRLFERKNRKFPIQENDPTRPSNCREAGPSLVHAVHRATRDTPSPDRVVQKINAIGRVHDAGVPPKRDLAPSHANGVHPSVAVLPSQGRKVPPRHDSLNGVRQEAENAAHPRPDNVAPRGLEGKGDGPCLERDSHRRLLEEGLTAC